MWSLESHPDTDIFSKRRKIYSICVDDRDDTDNETDLANSIHVITRSMSSQIFCTNRFNEDLEMTNLNYFLTQRKMQ